MAVPKKKTSPSRNGMRSSHIKVAVHALSKCDYCGELKHFHHVCGACGHYQKRKVLVTRAEKRLSKQEDQSGL